MAVDCERFDQGSLDLLYGELDEFAASGLRRHLSHCERCQTAWQKMVRTREAFHIDLDPAQVGLFEQIMAQEREAMAHLPAKQRLGRWVSIVAGYAMRPQLAMAALLLLMVGSSLVFVRGGPGLGDQVAVRETGSPVAESNGMRGRAAPLVVATEERRTESVDTPPLLSPLPERTTTGSEEDTSKKAEAAPVRVADYAEAIRAYQAGSYAEAERLFSEVAARGGEKAGSAALHEAHSARNGSGCQRAASTYDEVALRFRGTAVGDEASWNAANCYRALAQLDRARAHLELLKDHPAYKAQVERALASMAVAQAEQTVASRSANASVPAAKPTVSAAAPTKAAVAAAPETASDAERDQATEPPKENPKTSE